MVTQIDPTRQIKQKWTNKEKIFFILAVIGIVATLYYGQRADKAENKVTEFNQVKSQVANKAEQIYQYTINIQGDPTFNNLSATTQESVQVIGKLSADAVSLMSPDASRVKEGGER